MRSNVSYEMLGNPMNPTKLWFCALVVLWSGGPVVLWFCNLWKFVGKFLKFYEIQEVLGNPRISYESLGTTMTSGPKGIKVYE